MPIPNKKPGETSKDFMIRCMSDPTMVSEYPRKDQRMAICAVQERKDRERFGE